MTAPIMDATASSLDPGLVFLVRAAARLTLVEACKMSVDEAIAGLIPAFEQLVDRPICEASGCPLQRHNHPRRRARRRTTLRQLWAKPRINGRKRRDLAHRRHQRTRRGRRANRNSARGRPYRRIHRQPRTSKVHRTELNRMEIEHGYT